MICNNCEIISRLHLHQLQSIKHKLFYDNPFLCKNSVNLYRIFVRFFGKNSKMPNQCFPLHYVAFMRHFESHHEFFTQIRHFLYKIFGYFFRNVRYLIKQSAFYRYIVMYNLAVFFCIEIIAHKTVIASTKQT